MNEKDFPIILKYERDKEIGRAQRKAEKVKVSNYVKTMLVPGVILATITFFNVGPWYDRNYGFDGSASAAFSAAICVIIGCAFFGLIVGGFIKSIRFSKVDKIKIQYDELAKEVECKAHSMSLKFSNNEHIKAIVNKLTESFICKVKEKSRPNYEKEISVSANIDIFATEVRCNNVTYLNFKLERLAELVTVSERKAIAQAIAENVAVRVKEQIPIDISGTLPTINVSYRYVGNDAVEAIITYKCINGFFKEVDAW